MQPYLIAQGAESDSHADTAHPVRTQAEAGHGEGGHAEGGSGISIGSHVVREVPGLGHFHADTVLFSGLVMILVLAVFAGLGRTVSVRPGASHAGTIVEGVVAFCQKIIRDFIGENTAKYLWFIGAIFTFVLVANWLSLLPWTAWGHLVADPVSARTGIDHHLLTYHAPTADLNTTAALGVLALVAYWFFGIQTNGVGKFLGHHWFAKPVALFPLRMLEDLTRPVSLALRLFANMTAGHVVGLVLLTLTYFVVPAVLLPLELFVGAVQAFIFATLTASYIGGAVAEHH